jgi:hypothetical protein
MDFACTLMPITMQEMKTEVEKVRECTKKRNKDKNRKVGDIMC